MLYVCKFKCLKTTKTKIGKTVRLNVMYFSIIRQAAEGFYKFDKLYNNDGVIVESFNTVQLDAIDDLRDKKIKLGIVEVEVVEILSTCYEYEKLVQDIKQSRFTTIFKSRFISKSVAESLGLEISDRYGVDLTMNQMCLLLGLTTNTNIVGSRWFKRPDIRRVLIGMLPNHEAQIDEYEKELTEYIAPQLNNEPRIIELLFSGVEMTPEHLEIMPGSILPFKIQESMTFNGRGYIPYRGAGLGALTVVEATIPGGGGLDLEVKQKWIHKNLSEIKLNCLRFVAYVDLYGNDEKDITIPKLIEVLKNVEQHYGFAKSGIVLTGPTKSTLSLKVVRKLSTGADNTEQSGKISNLLDSWL